MSGNQSGKLRAVFLAFVMISSVTLAGVALTGTAAAANGDFTAPGNTPASPADLPTDSSDASQDITTEPNDLGIEGGATDISIRIDVSDLNDSADLSGASVSVNDGNPGGLTNVNGLNFKEVSGGTIFLSLDVSGDVTFDDGDITLSGIDTTGATEASGLDYVFRTDEIVDPTSSNFQAQDITTSETFSLASIPVENLATGEQITETNLGAAIAEANGGDGDLTVNAGDEVEIRLANGTFQTTTNTLDAGNPVRIVAADGAEPTIQSTGTDPLIDITDAGSALTVDGVDFDLNDNAVTALQVTDQASDLSVTDATFDNSDGSEYIEVDDAAGTVEITGSTFLDPDGDDPTHILASDDTNDGENADLTLDSNVFNDTATAVDLSNTPEDFNSLTVENNEFNNNNKHVDADSSGEPDLDAIFVANTFDQYAITEDNNGNILFNNDYAIYGDLGAVDTGDVDTAQATTIVSAGDHDLTTTTFDVDNDQVSLVAADGTAAENVTVAIDQAAVEATSDISDLTISGITFDGSAIAFDAGGQTINGLTVTDNRFVNLDGDTIAIDASDNSDGDVLNSFDISNNFFSPSADDGSDYDAVNVDQIDDPGDGNDVVATISDNNVTGTDGTAITITELTDSNSNSQDILLTVSDNEIEVTGTSGNGGISLAALDVNNDDEVVDVTGNALTAADGVGTTTAIDVDTSGDTTVNVLDNSITSFDDASSVALDITDFGSNSGLTVEDNDFDDNGAHIDFDSGSVDAASLESSNNFATFVFDTTAKDDTFEDQVGDVIYGTVGGGITNVDSGGNFIQVRPGTYEESGLTTESGSGANLVATGSASETVLTTSAEATILDIDGGREVDGFTFASTTDSSDTDVTITAGGAELSNSTFSGPGTEDRTAIAVSDDDADPEVVNVTVSDYAVGITADSTGSNVVGIQDSTVTDSDVGIEVQTALNNNGVEIVRNTIADNTVGVDVADPTGGTIAANFNNLVNNEDASVQFADVSDLDIALANWWGDEAGPNVSEDTGADVVVDNIDDIDDEQTRPWLDDTVDTLSQDGLVLVTDPSTPSAGGDTTSLGDGALWVVATLDDDEASNVNADDITLTTQDGPDSLQNINRFSDADDNTIGEVSAADPIKISSDTGGSGDNEFTESILPASTTAGDYTVGVFDTADNAESGSAVQTFTAPVAGVNVTADTEELAADGDTEATVTLQLVDDAGDAVARSGVNTEFAISNSGAAGTSRVSTETTTDTNGEAELVVTADTVGETFTVTGIDTDGDNSDSVSIDTVEPSAANFTLDLVEGPTTITQNESYSATVNVTNEGDAAGTQDITYDLEDSTGISQVSATEEDVQLNASASQEVTFEVAASDTESLSTGNFTHVFSSNDDELTLDVTVQAAADEQPVATVTFDDQTVPNGTEEITVASANFTLANGSAGDYVVVVHVVNATEFDGGVDNSISAPVGASGDLTGAEENITVDLNSSDAFEDGDALDSLTENVTLRAMLHTTDNDSVFGTRLGSAIDGLEPGDETDDANITVQDEPASDPVERFDTNGEPGIQSGEVLDAISAFNEGEEGVESGDVLDVISAFNEA